MHLGYDSRATFLGTWTQKLHWSGFFVRFDSELRDRFPVEAADLSEKSCTWPTSVSHLERKIEACVAVEVPRTLIAGCACASFQFWMCQTPLCVVTELASIGTGFVCSVLRIADVGMAFSLAKDRGLSRSRFNRHSPGFNRHSPGFVCSVLRIAAGMAFSLAKTEACLTVEWSAPHTDRTPMSVCVLFIRLRECCMWKTPFCVVNSLQSHWGRGKRRTFSWNAVSV